MTELDRETQAAVESLAHRYRVRDAAIRDGEDVADPEVAAREFMTAMLGRGWRLTEARRIPLPTLKQPGDGGTGPTEEWRRIRAERLRQHADHLI